MRGPDLGPFLDGARAGWGVVGWQPAAGEAEALDAGAGLQQRATFVRLAATLLAAELPALLAIDPPAPAPGTPLEL